jgi:magnesium chelatase family protein
VRANAQLPVAKLDSVAPISTGATRLLERRLREGTLSARGLDRVRRVALTVADLAECDGLLSEEHVLVALALRAPGVLGHEGPVTRGASGTGQAGIPGLVRR